MNRLITAVIMLGLAVAWTGCTTAPKVQSSADPAARFDTYKTYALMPLPDQIPGADPGVMLRLGPTLSQALDESLRGKGYAPVDRNAADFTAHIRGKVVPGVDVKDWGYTYNPGLWYRRTPYSGGGYREVSVENYEEGTLIIDLYDGKTKKLVWSGWSSGRKGSKDPKPEVLRETVRLMMEEFPPKK